MKLVRHSGLVLAAAALLWPAVGLAQTSAPITKGRPGSTPSAPAPPGAPATPAAPAGGAASPATPATKTDRPPQATMEKKVILPAPAPGPAPGAADPALGRRTTPSLPPFVLSEIYYYEPGTGTKYQAKKQGSAWVLPVVDTLKEWSVTFLFTSNVPKEEIADIVQKKACCYQLLLSNQSLKVLSLTFFGDRVFLRASVPDMQHWPKTVQLKMFHSGGMATPSDVTRRPSSGGGMADPSAVSRTPSFRGGVAPSPGDKSAITPVQKAPILRPFMDYKSTPVSVQAAKVGYFETVLYPTFSHARCTDCHSMGDPATVEAQHEAGGVSGVNGTSAHKAGCGGSSCHTLVKDWRTPPFAKGIHWKGKSAKEICNIVIGHLPTAGGLQQHFHDDPRVIWAVSSGWVPAGGGKGQRYLQTAPPHDKQAWFSMVDYWIMGGFPCPE